MGEISAVLTAHDASREHLLRRCLRSLHGEVDEAVGVLPPGPLVEAFSEAAPEPYTVVVEDDLPGLSGSRNIGAGAASGDVYAFLDDDVEVRPGWGDEARELFREGATAAGGPAHPNWEESRPVYLPKRWDWLVGCGPYHDERTVVRNTYGCNIAFRADVFDELGGFDEEYGMDGDLTQGEETELARRMAEEFGRGTAYSPDMDVSHRVPAEKTRPLRLLRRCWAQGVTKARMGAGDEEGDFLRDAVEGLPGEGLVGAAASLSFISATGLGYLAGSVSRED